MNQQPTYWGGGGYDFSLNSSLRNQIVKGGGWMLATPTKREDKDKKFGVIGA